MNKALELAKNPSDLVALHRNPSWFVKGDKRAIEAGRKGGSQPHTVGSIKGLKYRSAGYDIEWDEKKCLWRATNGKTTLYERSVRRIKRECQAYKGDESGFETLPPEQDA